MPQTVSYSSTGGPTAARNVFIRLWGNTLKGIKYGKNFYGHFADVLGRGFTVKGMGR